MAVLAAKAAQTAGRPEAAAFKNEARRYYDLLRRSYPGKELARYTRTMAQLEQGDSK